RCPTPTTFPQMSYSASDMRPTAPRSVRRYRGACCITHAPFGGMYELLTEDSDGDRGPRGRNAGCGAGDVLLAGRVPRRVVHRRSRDPEHGSDRLQRSCAVRGRTEWFVASLR